MKKIILSMGMLVSVLGTASSQTLVDGTQNLLIPFSGASCLGSCCDGTVADVYYGSGGNVDRANSTMVNGSYKKIMAVPTVVVTSPMFMDIYAVVGGGCNPARTRASIDMSINQKVRVKAKTASGTATLQFWLGAETSIGLANNGSSTFNINGAGGSVVKSMSLTTTSTDFVLDYSGDADFGTWAGNNAIDMYGLTITAGDGVEIHLQEIEFGYTAPSSTSSANVVNDQVNLFPNPAKGAFTVDVTAMNVESALVKVMNANGSVVKEFTATEATTVSTEGMNKGIYMVQVTSGNKVANKKVVVQ